MLPTKFQIIWQSGFTGEEFLKLANQKQESPVVAMFVNGSGRNEQSLYRTFHRCFLLSFRSFSQAVSEEKNF
jgi:N-acetyl-gamma-glutamylphosphate reductase